MTTNPVAATLLLIGLTSTAYADFTGRVVNVADGDTITVLRDQKWLRLFEQHSPIYKWNQGGLLTAKRSPRS